MKKYLQEVMANPEYRKAFEEDEIFATLVTAMARETQSEVQVVHLLCKHLKDLCEELARLRDLCEKLKDAPNKETLTLPAYILGIWSPKYLYEEVEHIKDLCKKLEDTNADVGVFEIDTGAPNKEMLEKRFKEEIHKFKAQYGEPPEVILAGKDIQLLLADYIIVSNRAFKPEKTLFGVPLEDGIEGTIAFASGRR